MVSPPLPYQALCILYKEDIASTPEEENRTPKRPVQIQPLEMTVSMGIFSLGFPSDER